MSFPYERQKTPYNCGPAALRMLLRHKFGVVPYSQNDIAEICNTHHDGTLTQDLRKAAEYFDCTLTKLTLTKAKKLLCKNTPLLISYKDSHHSGHFSIAVSLTELKHFKREYMINLKDPYYGSFKMPFSTMKTLSPHFYLLEDL